MFVQNGFVSVGSTFLESLESEDPPVNPSSETCLRLCLLVYFQARLIMSSTTPCRLTSSWRKTLKLIRPISSHSLHGHVRRAPDPTSPEVMQLLSQHASSPPRPLNLSTLLSFGRPLTPLSVLSSVSYALSEIPRRLATRVRSLEALPFIVGMNPYVANTLKAYRESFEWLATYPPVTNLEENAVFAAKLEGLVKKHANDIPTMAMG